MMKTNYCNFSIIWGILFLFISPDAEYRFHYFQVFSERVINIFGLSNKTKLTWNSNCNDITMKINYYDALKTQLSKYIKN